MAGDVIGCCIDLDEGTISYSRLGNLMKKLFCSSYLNNN